MAGNEVYNNEAAGAAHPPPSAAAGPDLSRLKAVLDRFEITIAEANELAVLQDYKMILICDDSGSMSTGAFPGGMRTLGSPAASRWDELKETVNSMVEIASCLDPAGVDVYFLNRQAVMAAHGAADARLVAAFAPGPAGGTPLTEVVQRVAAALTGERPLLMFIFTDGEPNGGADPFKRALRSLVTSRRMRVQIMACTSNDDEIGWLNAFDRELKEVDVTDDYYAEKQEVMKAGLASKFTRGDWCMKAMLGPVSHKFDGWDERRRRQQQGCCDLM